jgi:hypothetical protein
MKYSPSIRFLIALFCVAFFSPIFGQTCAGNLLQNPDFTTNNLSNWGTVGTPDVAANAVRLKIIGDRIYQSKPAIIGKTYVLKASMKNVGGTAAGILAIKFFDGNWRLARAR